jgi:hypothetical protein
MTPSMNGVKCRWNSASATNSSLNGRSVTRAPNQQVMNRTTRMPEKIAAKICVRASADPNVPSASVVPDSSSRPR